MKTAKAMLVLMVLPLLALAQGAAPGVTVKEATGEAAIVNGNKDKARDEAKKRALRTAIEEVAGVVVKGDTVTRDNVLVMDRVTAQTEGYVRKVQVLSEKEDRGVLAVTVRAEIGVKELEKDVLAVRGIVERLGRSKLMVVIQEAAIDEKGIASRSEVLSTELSNVFKKDGWLLIDEKGTGEGFSVSSGVAVGKLDPKEVAKKHDVDFIIYGSVNMRYLPPQPGQMIPEVDAKGKQLLYFVTADYDLSMMEVRSGRQLAKTAGKFDHRVVGGLPTGALGQSYKDTSVLFSQREGPRIANELRGKAIEVLRDQDVNGAAVTVQVSNLPDFNSVDDLEKAFGAIQGVQRVKQVGDYRDGKAEFEVVFLGTSRELGKMVGAATFKKKKLLVSAVLNNRVEVALGK